MKGRARNLSLFHTNEKELDPLAFQIVDADRFNPGTYGGSPVLVAVSVEVDLQACIVKSGDTAGNNATYLQLRSQPMQKINAFSLSHPLERDVLADVNSFWMGSTDSDNAAAPTVRVGGSVTAPVPLNNVEAAYSDVARSAKCQGNVVLSLIVDAHGMPQNIRIIKKLGYGLDEKAIEAVSKYRFKPAMKNGQPVPVMIDVEVNFHLD
jgi:TonB family protein